MIWLTAYLIIAALVWLAMAGVAYPSWKWSAIFRKDLAENLSLGFIAVGWLPLAFYVVWQRRAA